MHIGLHITKFDNPNGSGAIRGELAAVAEAAEGAGAAWLSVMDHYFQMQHNGGAEDAMLEAYTTLSFLAANTSTVQLGALVTGVTYRHPGLLAKIVTTLDVLSGGRATLGIGAAWYDREHIGLGVPYPELKERFERLEEAIQICRQMWDPSDNGPYNGTHYQLAETINVPPAVSQPRPKILIGGGGERKTLRLVAKYADACNLFIGESPDDLSHKLDVLKKHCDEVGRDYAEIKKTAVIPRATLTEDTINDFRAFCAPYAALGITEAHLVPPTGTPAEWIRKVATPAAQQVADL